MDLSGLSDQDLVAQLGLQQPGAPATEAQADPLKAVPDRVLRRALGLPVEPGDTSSRPAGVSFLRGIPVAGAYADRAAAALNAAAQPVLETGLSNKPSFGERYEENKQRIKEQTDQFGEQHPIEATVDQLAGGTAATAPLIALAAPTAAASKAFSSAGSLWKGAAAAPSVVAGRALGLTGPLWQRAALGGASNAAIGAADAAARGEDPVHGAEVAGLVGAGLPLGGRLVGATVNRVANAFRGEAPRPNPTVKVAGAEIPQWESARTGDVAAGAAEQQAIHGSSGPQAQEIGQQALSERDAALAQARRNIGQQMAPPGGVAPAEAGDQAITELAQQRNNAMAAQAGREAAAAAESQSIRQDMGQPGVAAPLALDAGENTSQAIGQAAREAAARRTQAYQRVGEVDGQFLPASFDRIDESLARRMNSGPADARVRVSDLTPRTQQALALIQDELGYGRNPQNLVDPANQRYRGMLDAGVIPVDRPPITGRDIESVRQQLVPLMRDANNAARAPGGSFSDARAMRRLMEAFDNHVRDVVNFGGFSGNGQEYLRRLEVARAAHASYRGRFSARGQGDVVGPVVEKIIGKHPGQELTADRVNEALYGSANNPGGGSTVQVSQRAREILGPESQAWQAAKQGLLSHVMDVPAGMEALSPAKQADRIQQLLNGRGRALSQVYFSPEERARLAQHADQLRALVPHDGPLTVADRAIMRLSGIDGNEIGTIRDAAGMLINPTATSKAGALEVAGRLKENLSPNSWNHLRQHIFETITTKPEGMTEFGPQALSNRIAKFLGDPLAKRLYSPQELQMMRILQQEYAKAIPLPGTANPSGSGIWLSRVGKAAMKNLLPMLGFVKGGVSGAAAGVAANKALAFVSNRRAANQARDLFYGRPSSVNRSTDAYERMGAIAAKVAPPLLNGP
jgi:hypothetical protein